MSMTVMRLEMAICGAARPIPCAAYMDSNISSMSLARAESNSVTSTARLARTGSGYFHDLVELAGVFTFFDFCGQGGSFADCLGGYSPLH